MCLCSAVFDVYGVRDVVLIFLKNNLIHEYTDGTVPYFQHLCQPLW